ncbi:MAG: 4-hydroxy-tetrahydrodipicolinate synthase [Clostridia bacterium]
MKNTIFTGAGVAIVTPFNDDLTVNYDKLGELIDFQIENLTDAIIICGTTGEACTLTDDEHKLAIEYTVKRVNGRVPVVAGTGSNHTEYFLELSKFAKEVGADALLAVTPYYNKATMQGLIKHFFYVADRVDLPMIIYNVPSRTGINITPETCLELSKHKNIVAVKDATGNIGNVAKIAALCGDNLDIYSGNDDQIVPILSLGGKGVISVSSNILPLETHNICQYYLDGDTNSSLKLQLQYLDLINALFCEVNPIPIKAAMNLMGMNVGSLRLPLTEISESALEKLKISMQKAGKI